MKKITAFIMILTMAVSAVDVSVCAKNEKKDTEIFVSQTGSDNNDGTYERPLKSFRRAKQLASGKKSAYPESEITVNFMGGEYYVDSQVDFDTADSGNEKGSIVFKAYNNEDVKFKSSVKISGSKFKKVTDRDMIERIPETARGRMRYISFADVGVGTLDPYSAWVGGSMCKPSYPQLFVDGDKQELSRWPNEGYVYTGKMLDAGINSGAIFRGGIGYDAILNGRGFTFKYNENEPDKWTKAKNFMLEGYFTYDYFFGAYNVSSIDTKLKTITTVQGSNGWGAIENRRWYARNLIEEADLPGEYYIDYENSRIYLNQPYDLTDSEIEIVFNENQFAKLDRVSYITFEGIEFEKTRSSAFQIYNCDNIKFTNCKFTDIGKRGMEVYNSTGITVDSCEFRYIGGSAIYLSGGDFITLTSSENKITNSVFYRWGEYQRSYEPGINITDVASEITGNVFHNAPFSACLMAGNDNKFMYNEVYDVLKGLNDGGAFYLGMNATRRGNEVAYNYVHDLYEGLKGASSIIVGLYFDDGSSGNHIHHNIVTDAHYGITTSGRDNVVHDNLVSSATNTSITVDNRGETWQKNQYFNEDGSVNYNSLFIRLLLSVPYESEPYEKYPHLSNIFEDPIPMNIPAYNSIYNNLTIDGKYGFTDSAVKYATKMENNIKREDTSDIEDFENRNFKIKQSSDLYQTLSGINDINLEKIGTVHKNDNKAPMQLAPQKNSTNVDASEIFFSWTEVPHADKYILRIAKDKEMKQIVKTVKVSETFSLVKGLDDARTRYYWTVEAIDEGYRNSMDVTSNNVNMFITAYYNSIDKTELVNIQRILSDMLLTMVQGDKIGEYSEEFIENTKALLSEVTKIINMPQATEYIVKSEVEKAQNFISTIKTAANPGYRNISEILDAGKWSGIELNGSAFSIQGTAGYNTVLTPNEALCFRIKNKASDKSINLALRSNVKQINSYEEYYRGYEIEINNREIFLIKNTDGNKTVISAVPNTFITDGEEHEIRIAAPALKNGIKLIFYVDDQMVFGYKDIEDPITAEGYFVIKGNVQISASENLPEFAFNPNEDYNPKPYYLDMKELLSSADNWEGNGAFSVYDGVLKAENGTQIWTKDIIPQNAIVRFMGKFSPGNSWQGIAVKDCEPSKMPWDRGVNDYLVCLKPVSVEIQTFNKGKNIYYCIQDANLDWNEWHEYEMASYETEKGVKVILKIDGKTYLTYDDENPITVAGHLAIFDFAKLGYEIKACE